MIGFDTTGCKTATVHIERPNGPSMRALVVAPEKSDRPSPVVLWLHGGGYLLGFPEMVYMSRAADLVRACGATVVCPAYRLSIAHPYPAALEDAYAALNWTARHARGLGCRSDQIMVGGESAGGGLCAAVCLYARDREGPSVAFQMPLYPMLDCRDTPTSANNHARVWNTRRNHAAWKLYLRKTEGDIPAYASPALEKDLAGLPPCYTFVGTAEPFFFETFDYVDRLKKAGVDANLDVYDGMYHAFDMMDPTSDIARKARANFISAFKEAQKSRFAPQAD